MPDLPPLYPLKFRPIYKPKVWGGRAMEKLGRQLPGGADTSVGESWELADLDRTSPSGAGGDPECSIVRNGPLAGQSLREVIAAYGERLLGRVALTPRGGFPLLVKLLDARQNLSVQVHPGETDPASSDAGDPRHEPKSEAWYVLDAAPGACIYKGLRPGVTRDQLHAAATAGTREAIEPLLVRVPVKPGDCHYLPGGTCHAIGAGVLLAEIQTPSDTTYRVFDWGRAGRELHLVRALQCMRYEPADVRRHERRSHIAGMFTTVTRLVLCEHFRVEKVRMVESYEQEIPYDQPAVWFVLEGKGRIASGPSGGRGAETVTFERGETLLLPAHFDEGRVSLDADTTWLEVTFPKALPEQIA